MLREVSLKCLDCFEVSLPNVFGLLCFLSSWEDHVVNQCLDIFPIHSGSSSMCMSQTANTAECEAWSYLMALVAYVTLNVSHWRHICGTCHCIPFFLEGNSEMALAMEKNLCKVFKPGGMGAVAFDAALFGASLRAALRSQNQLHG